MIVMAMGKSNGIDFNGPGFAVQGEAFAAFALGMHAGIKEDAVVIDFDEPSTGTNFGVGI
jgi:hypothetical protein